MIKKVPKAIACTAVHCWCTKSLPRNQYSWLAADTRSSIQTCRFPVTVWSSMMHTPRRVAMGSSLPEQWGSVVLQISEQSTCLCCRPCRSELIFVVSACGLDFEPSSMTPTPLFCHVCLIWLLTLQASDLLLGHRLELGLLSSWTGLPDVIC